MPTLYLFADSNLFLHYKSLKQIDWLRLGNCDDIKVVVCRTVQRELDALKDGRAGRRSDRARKAASILLKVAQHGPEAQEAASPRVALNLYRRRRRALAFSVPPIVLSDMAPALTAGSTAWAATPRRAWHPSASSRPTAPHCTAAAEFASLRRRHAGNPRRDRGFGGRPCSRLSFGASPFGQSPGNWASTGTRSASTPKPRARP